MDQNTKNWNYTKSIQTKINCTRVSVRNSYLTIEDKYKHRCEIKISTFYQNQTRRSLKENGESTSLQHNPNELESMLKTRTFSKLGLGISEIGKRISWRRRRECLPMGSLEFGARNLICKRKLGLGVLISSSTLH